MGEISDLEFGIHKNEKKCIDLAIKQAGTNIWYIKTQILRYVSACLIGRKTYYPNSTLCTGPQNNPQIVDQCTGKIGWRLRCSVQAGQRGGGTLVRLAGQLFLEIFISDDYWQYLWSSWVVIFPKWTTIHFENTASITFSGWLRRTFDLFWQIDWSGKFVKYCNHMQSCFYWNFFVATFLSGNLSSGRF